ncbi:MAG: DNA-3-methyladenine glycosylase 2 [Armatimonadetes bacterium]|nr:DNA-3-methyladenine glycosylase 2 [Armatimonadota bacterium]
MSELIRIQAAPPFRLDFTVWALRRRVDNQIDRWDGQTYSRAFLTRKGAVEVSVTQSGPTELQASVTDAEVDAAPILTRLLGLNVNMKPFFEMARKDSRLWELAMRFQGFHPPRYPTLFEALVNAVCCQQITLTVGLQILSRVCAALGQHSASGLAAFPEPEALAAADFDELRALKLSRAKANSLIALGEAFANGEVDEAELEPLEDEAIVERLSRLKGIGRWSAEYALLRGFGRTNLFPGDDVGARGRLQSWLGIEAPLDYKSVHEILSAWRPYAGLVYFHMLLSGLDHRGLLES